jgi:hypothetical protein
MQISRIPGGGAPPSGDKQTLSEAMRRLDAGEATPIDPRALPLPRGASLEQFKAASAGENTVYVVPLAGPDDRTTQRLIMKNVGPGPDDRIVETWLDLGAL